MKQNAVGELKARALAWRYGHPARGLKVLAVAGGSGKTTTALLLNEILLESGASVAAFIDGSCLCNGKDINGGYDTSADELLQQLQRVKKMGAYYVVIEITEALLATSMLSVLPVEMSIVTNESSTATALLEQPANALVIPEGFPTDGLRVAPHQLISFGTADAAEAQITRIGERRKGTEVDLVIDHQTQIAVATYLIGHVNALNVAAAVAAAYVLAIDTKFFEEGVARLERVVGNYEYIQAEDLPYDVIIDGARQGVSLQAVIHSAKKLSRRRLLVVADASVNEKEYEGLSKTSDRAFVVNDGPELAGVEKMKSVTGALAVARRAAKKDDTILLLGKEVAAAQADGKTYAQQLIGEKQTDEQ